MSYGAYATSFASAGTITPHGSLNSRLDWDLVERFSPAESWAFVKAWQKPAVIVLTEPVRMLGKRIELAETGS